MLTVKTIVETIYEKWAEAVSEYVGDSYGMKNSGTISNFPYASCIFKGLPGVNWDLEGNCGVVRPTIQIDIFTTGQKDISQAYLIDEVSDKALESMGFRRYLGPEPTPNIDPSVSRFKSEYERVIGYGDSL